MVSQVCKQGQILSKTILSYLSSLSAYHIDYGMSLQLFKGPRLNFFIKSGKLTIVCTNTVCLSIIRKILIQITRHQMTNDDKLNIDGAVKVA